MTKKKVIFFVIVSLALIYWFFKYFYGWMEFRKNTDTPREFLNHTVVSKKDYFKDSVEIWDKLRSSLLSREDFFSNRAYFDSTEVIIDSIVYSPDLKKIAAIVIVKNPTYRQLMPDKKYDWYYDATCYLGIKQNDTITISWLGPVYTNSYNKQNISNDIREACFRTFVTKDSVGPNAYKYNLNDIRFWDSKIWKEIEEKRIRNHALSQPSPTHSEDVYAFKNSFRM